MKNITKNFMKVKLSEIVELNFGQYLRPTSEGAAKYLQAKNFSADGDYLDNVELFMDNNDIQPKHLLRQDDILFVSKGMRFFAFKYDTFIGPAIASSIFYVIKPNINRVLPDFLVCILNHPQSLNYFNGASAGSSIPSIRKNELLDFEIELPSLDEQQKLMDLYYCHKEQMHLLNQLKNKKQDILNQIILNTQK